MHHFVQSALVRNVKLFRIGGAFFLSVTTNGSSGTTANLRNTQLQNLFTYSLAFTGRNNHTGVRHCNTNQGNQFSKDFIVNAVGKGGRVNVICTFNARYANGVRTNTVNCFKMFCVHQESCKFVLVAFQTKEHAQTYVINATFHGSVHCFRMVSVIVFGSSGVQLLVAFLVVSFLEQNVSANACFFQLAVVLHSSSRNVYVYATDSTVLMFNGVNRLYALQNIFDRIVYRVFARFQRQTLVTHILQSNYFSSNFLLGKLLASNMLILHMIRTVGATINAVVGKIQGSKHNDAVAVKIQLNLLCQLVNSLQDCFVLTRQKHGSFTIAQAFTLFSLR